MSRDTVHIDITLAAFNYLEVKTSDIMNTYVNGPITEKIWTIIRPEFNENARKVALIVRYNYGIKSAFYISRNHLLGSMNFFFVGAFILCSVDYILYIDQDMVNLLNW